MSETVRIIAGMAILFACLLVFWRHKANIVRLIKGEEK